MTIQKLDAFTFKKHLYVDSWWFLPQYLDLESESMLFVQILNAFSWLPEHLLCRNNSWNHLKVCIICASNMLEGLLKVVLEFLIVLRSAISTRCNILNWNTRWNSNVLKLSNVKLKCDYLGEFWCSQIVKLWIESKVQPSNLDLRVFSSLPLLEIHERPTTHIYESYELDNRYEELYHMLQ